MDGRTDRQTQRRNDGHTDSRTEEWTDRLTDGRTAIVIVAARPTDGRTDSEVRTDRLTDGRTAIFIVAAALLKNVSGLKAYMLEFNPIN